MSGSKTSKASTPKTTRTRRPRTPLSSLPNPIAEVRDPANRATLKLFHVKRNQWGVVEVAARNPREARVLVLNGVGKSVEQQVRAGRVQPVDGVEGEAAFSRGIGE